jgi:hypothetical protein
MITTGLKIKFTIATSRQIYFDDWIESAVKEYCDCQWVCKPSLTLLGNETLSNSRRNLVIGNLERHLNSCVMIFEPIEKETA